MGTGNGYSIALREHLFLYFMKYLKVPGKKAGSNQKRRLPVFRHVYQRVVPSETGFRGSIFWACVTVSSLTLVSCMLLKFVIGQTLSQILKHPWYGQNVHSKPNCRLDRFYKCTHDKSNNSNKNVLRVLQFHSYSTQPLKLFKRNFTIPDWASCRFLPSCFPVLMAP